MPYTAPNVGDTYEYYDPEIQDDRLVTILRVELGFVLVGDGLHFRRWVPRGSFFGHLRITPVVTT